MSKLRLPPLGGVERVRLWLSYQRYGLVLTGGSAALTGLAVTGAPIWL